MLQACLLLSESSNREQETNTVSVGRKTARVSLSGIWPRTSSKSFTKILKVAMTLLRRVDIRIIIYIDDMLIMGMSLKEIELARDTTSFLLQNLGFVTKWEKSTLIPCNNIEFLGIKINSSNMTFTIPKKKTQSILQLCQETLGPGQTTRFFTRFFPQHLISKLRGC